MKFQFSARAWAIAILLAAYLALLGMAALTVREHEQRKQGGADVEDNDVRAL